MGWLDSVTDWVGDAVDVVGDWLGDNSGDIIELGGMVAGGIASEQEQEAVEDLAKLQANEISRVAAENAKLLRYDATVAEDQAQKTKLATDYAYWNNNRITDRVISAQTAGYGKAGVAASSGTPLTVAVSTKEEGSREGRVLLNNGRTEEQRLYSEAQKYNNASQQTLMTAAKQINILEEAMDDRLTAMEYNQWAQGLDNLFTVGFRNDWWR